MIVKVLLFILFLLFEESSDEIGFHVSHFGLFFVWEIIKFFFFKFLGFEGIYSRFYKKFFFFGSERIKLKSRK